VRSPQVEEELAALGVSADAAAGILAAMQAASLGELEALLGTGHEVGLGSGLGAGQPAWARPGGSQIARWQRVLRRWQAAGRLHI
jgi:hypothetical protein